MLARLCLFSLQTQVLPWHGPSRGGSCGVPALRLQAPPTHSPQGPQGGKKLGWREGGGGSSTSSALYKSSSNPPTKAKEKKNNKINVQLKKHQIPMLTNSSRALPLLAGGGPSPGFPRPPGSREGLTAGAACLAAPHRTAPPPARPRRPPGPAGRAAGPHSAGRRPPCPPRPRSHPAASSPPAPGAVRERQ